MKKRWLWISVMVSALCLLVNGCGGDGDKVPPTDGPTATSVPTPEPTATSTPTPEPTATSTPTPEPTATSTPTPEPTATSTPTPEPSSDEGYAKGLLTETGFESKWLNMRFTAPADAVMSTQKEMDALMGLGAELIYGDEAERYALYAQMTTVYEMQANWIYGVPIVQLMVEKLPYENMTAEQYLSVLKAQLQSFESPVYVADENLYLVEIGGQEYINLAVAADYGTGVYVYQDYCVRKQGDRMVVIIFSYVDGAEMYLTDALNAFSTYE